MKYCRSPLVRSALILTLGFVLLGVPFSYVGISAFQGDLCYLGKSRTFGGRLYDTLLEVISDVAVDSQGNIVAVGNTDEEAFPGIYDHESPTEGQFNTYGGGSQDAFVAKFNSDCNLLWYSFLGGQGRDFGAAVDVDPENNIIVCGSTTNVSTYFENDFPVSNGYDVSFNGGTDGFVSKFSPDGSMLWSTFFGGQATDACHAVCVDSDNRIFLCGHTTSDDLPNAENQALGTQLSLDDAFVAELSPDGTQALWSMYLGGSDLDWAFGIDATPNAGITIVGATMSDDFSPISGTMKSIQDGFVTRLRWDGSVTVEWSKYIGGWRLDWCKDVVVDSDNWAIVVGATTSTDFPIGSDFISYSAFDDSNNIPEGITNYNPIEYKDGVVFKMNQTGLLWSTYLGGDERGIDECVAVDVDSDGNILVSGVAASSDFPTRNEISSYSGGEDAFAALFTDLGVNRFSTTLGGSSDDASWGVAFGPTVAQASAITVVGYTRSLDFPTTWSTSEKNYEGGFITQLWDSPAPVDWTLILVLIAIIVIIIILVFGIYVMSRNRTP